MFEKRNKLSGLWFGLLLYTYFILLWGVFVRASRSGAGCGTSWPKCEGSFLFDVTNGAQIIEYIHRASSGLYGIIALALVGYTLYKRGFKHFGWLCMAFLFFVGLEAWIGRMLVVQELVVDDQRIKRLLWMGFHFFNTLTLTTNVILIWKQNKTFPHIQHRVVWGMIRHIFTSWLTLGFLIISILGIVTAFYDTSVIKAGQSAQALSGFINQLRNMHPLAAILYVLLVVYVFTNAEKETETRKLLLAVLILNLILGGLNVFFHHFTALQVAHVFVAHMIWLVLVLIGYNKNQNRLHF